MSEIMIDCEVYPNFFLLSCLDIQTGKQVHFELSERSPELNRIGINTIFKKHLTVSFNGLSFDIPLIRSALQNADNKELYDFAQEIISEKMKPWQIDNELKVPSFWSHIDLKEVAPGIASLKTYGARLHAKKLQDLPFDPHTDLSFEQMDLIKEYCINDLETTALLYNTLKKQIDLRISMSETYGMDLRSKSDAQIAELVLKSEIEKITGRKLWKSKDEIDSVNYKDPGFISFETRQLKTLWSHVCYGTFYLQANGSVDNPEWLQNVKIKIGESEYQPGIGGLHSCEKKRILEPDEDHVLIDADVSSYYPAIILGQKLAPSRIGTVFLKVYEKIVKSRLKAKKEGQKTVADSLKIVVNTSFGKFGNKYGVLYSPDLMLQVTISGQFALLMLIERLENTGISVVSANTDGIVALVRKDMIDTYHEICFDWMLTTTYNLEFSEYKKLVSRDVNNYFALDISGEIKRKGSFADSGLSKNPDLPICYDAVINFLLYNKPIPDTVKECKDLRRFVSIRKVEGGAVYNDEPLGRVVRFYYAKGLDAESCIKYAKNGNRVPKSLGSKPVMDLPNTFPYDVDHDRYIDAAMKILKDCGWIENA